MSIGQGLGAIGGAIIGFVTGGPAGALKGAYWGYTAGTFIDPPPGPHTEGPRLNDRVMQTSEDGVPLPTVFGTVRIAGNVIWSTGSEEIATTQDVGGGSGDGGGTYTSYTYRTDVAIAICSGEITGIRRIWADTKLVYDASETADLETILASSQRFKNIRVYTGTTTQQPDPLIQSVEGASSAPAFREIAYVVFEDLELADFGNRLPNFSFEVVKNGSLSNGILASAEDNNSFAGVAVHASAIYYDADTFELYYAMPIKDTRLESSQSISIRKFNLVDLSAPPTTVKVIDTPNATTCWGGGNGVTDSANLQFGLQMTDSGGGLMLANPLAATEDSVPSAHARAYAIKNNVYYVIDSANGLLKAYAIGDHLTKIIDYAPPFAITTSHDNTWCCCATNNHIYFGVKQTSSGHACILKYTLNGAYVGAYIDNTLIGCFVISDDEIYFTKSHTLYKTTDFFVTNQTFCTITGYMPQSRGDYNWSVHRLSGDIVCLGLQRSDGPYRVGVFTSRLNLSQGDESLETICNTLSATAGLDPSEYDYSALSADTVRGYTLSKPLAMRGALEPLQAAWQWDLSEVDGKLKAVKRGGAIVATLTETDLGAAETPTGATLQLTRNNETEIPSEIQVSYSDIDNDYHAGTQYARSLTAQHTHLQQISLPLVMTAQEAAQLADKLLGVARWSGAHSLAWSCTYAHARLAPGDVVSVPGYGRTWRARIEQIDMGMPGLVQVQAVPDLGAIYTSYATAADATGIGQQLSLNGDAWLGLIDSCMLRDADTNLGWYVALSSTASGWRGGALYKSSDAGATWGVASTASKNMATSYGTATTLLGNADSRVWDKANTLTVQMSRGAPSSATETAVLDGANPALVGAHGRWELIQYQTATLNLDGTYTLTNLLRGRRGTEWAAGLHVIGDTVILPTESTLTACPMTADELGAERLYRALTVGEALESIEPEAHTYTGQKLKPLAPADFQATQDTAGINLKWSRRNRIGKAWNSSGALTNSEASHAYEIDVIIGATVVRTISVTAAESVLYTKDQIITDNGGITATMTFAIYQLSATVGRGLAATASLAFVGLTVTPQITTITLGGAFTVGETWTVSLSPVTGSQVIGSRLAEAGDTNLNGVATALSSAITASLGTLAASTTVGAVGSVITITSNYYADVVGYFSNSSMKSFLIQNPSGTVIGKAPSYTIGLFGTFDGSSDVTGVLFSVAINGHLVTATGVAGNYLSGTFGPLLTALQADSVFAGLGYTFAPVYGLPGTSLAGYVVHIKVNSSTPQNGYEKIEAWSNDPSKQIIALVNEWGIEPIPDPIPQITRIHVEFSGTATAGAKYTININSSSFTVTASGGESQADIGAALIIAINAGSEPVTASLFADTDYYAINLTGDVANTPFTASATASLGGTMAIAVTQNYALT